MRRNPYSSAEIDRASHRRESDDDIEDLLVATKTRFIPIDNERNPRQAGSRPPFSSRA